MVPVRCMHSEQSLRGVCEVSHPEGCCVHLGTVHQMDLRINPETRGPPGGLPAGLGGYRCYPSFADEGKGPTEVRSLTL